VEDLYRPYRQKRRTRATIAKEKGIEPLAKIVWEQEEYDIDELAKEYLSEEKELHTTEEVLAGVNDIIAEWISDEAEFREYIRDITFKRGTIQSAVKDRDKDEKSVYEMYYEYSEPIRSLVSHRILALNRGEKEDVLRVTIEPPVERIIEYLTKKVMKRNGNNRSQDILQEAISDSYK